MTFPLTRQRTSPISSLDAVAAECNAGSKVVHVLVYAALIGTLFGLSACTSTPAPNSAAPNSLAPNAPAPSTPAPTPQSSPTPNALANAIEATASRGAANLMIEITSNTESLAGVGSASLTSKTGQLMWTNVATAEEFTELNNKDGLYTQLDGSWYLAPAGTISPTSGAMSPLAGLSGLMNTSQDPLVGRLPLTIESGLNFSEEDLTNLPSDCPTFINVQITVNSAGLITGITKEFTCPEYQRVSSTFLSDFGTSINLLEPVDPIAVPGNQ